MSVNKCCVSEFCSAVSQTRLFHFALLSRAAFFFVVLYHQCSVLRSVNAACDLVSLTPVWSVCVCLPCRLCVSSLLWSEPYPTVPALMFQLFVPTRRSDYSEGSLGLAARFEVRLPLKNTCGEEKCWSAAGE